MKRIKTVLACIIITLAVWSCFSWPLPTLVNKGIANSFSNQDKNHSRYMIHGDHLQFLYHLWLFSDTINNNAPLFNNVYEFNDGDDNANKKIQFYYFPFSFIFTIFFTFLNRAASYNLTGLVSLFFTFCFTFIITKRFTEHKRYALAIALISICFPYRWATLLGGSPTGLAMLWVPMMVCGIDKAVRDNSFLGGIAAGTAILFAFFTDTHVFYFAVLSSPVWYLFYLVNKPKFSYKKISHWFKLINGTMPIIFLGLISIALSYFTKKDLSASTMAGGRSWHEVALFSPFWKGLFTFGDLGPDNHVYLGWALLGLLTIGALFFITLSLYSHRKHKKRDLFNFLFFYTGIFIVASLALGTNGPFMAKLFQAARKLIPHYDMIRQSSKILCLMPTLAALASIFTLNYIFYIIKDNMIRKILVILFTVVMITEYFHQIDPSICLMNEKQGAYGAISTDSINTDTKAHMLGITLWPGDSAFSSVYEYYVSLYGIRMINGYAPVVKKGYFEDIFRFFESMNMGDFTKKQQENLLQRNINYVVMHEDLYPEKVSPFPVTFAIKNLLADDKLTLLKQDRSIWAFKVNKTPKESKTKNKLQGINTFFPARNFEYEHNREDIKALIEKHPTASNERFLRLEKDNASTLPAFYTPKAENARFMVRIKGKGQITADILHKEDVTESVTIDVNNEKEWYWQEIFLTKHDIYSKIQLRTTCTGGTVDLDMALFTAGFWDGHLKETKKVTLPAPLFFHSGYINTEKNTIEIEKEKVNAPPMLFSLEKIKKLRGNQNACLYGLRLPLTQGKYMLDFKHKTKAKKGTILGSIHIRCGNQVIFFTPIYAGMPTPKNIYIPYNKPISFDFIYAGKADISIEGIEFTKVPDDKK